MGVMVLNQDKKALIEQVIALPLALRVFAKDKKHFEPLYVGNVYLDLFDSLMEQIQKDITTTKQTLFREFRITVQQVNDNQYKWTEQGVTETVTYTAEELKQLTAGIMHDYLSGSRPISFHSKNRMWKTMDMPPPDGDMNFD